MKVVKREDVEGKRLPGRLLQLVVGGKEAVSFSKVMTMGFAHYSLESGKMEPHCHAEEIVLVLGAENGWIRCGGFGDKPDELGKPVPLEVGMVLHIPENEWHFFGYDKSGYVNIAFFYAQSDIYSR
jgi:hypothetical protein